MSATKEDKIPSLDELKKCLPPHVFRKSLATSLGYMAFDFLVIGTMFAGYLAFLRAPFASYLLNALVTLAYWTLSGFYVWCIFVVGHDCGHTSFSNSPFANALFGHVCHGAILVPFWSWKRSHHFHHLYHHHETEDYSWPWMTERIMTDPANAGMMIKLQESKLLRFVMTPLLFPAYLLYGQDGSHFLPTGRLYEKADLTAKVQCVVSGASVFLAGYLFYRLVGQDLGVWLLAYFIPVMCGHYWVTMVTYLQHHNTHTRTVVFDDTNFGYIAAGLHTIDRTYGWGIDWLHHRISDCHVVHHLFFTQIPHYHLREATDAIVEYMDKHHPGLYKHVPTRNFATEIFRMFYTHSFDADLVSTKTIAEGGPYDPAFDKKAE